MIFFEGHARLRSSLQQYRTGMGALNIEARRSFLGFHLHSVIDCQCCEDLRCLVDLSKVFVLCKLYCKSMKSRHRSSTR
jgi:hypothetical protein